ncbi:MAG: UDP-N-acetylmuramate dehydrogenase [Gemmataceae bacterium]|nr:UDP-N-acetylmuramate dehydrogenase [Gemmataceae bacterium]
MANALSQLSAFASITRAEEKLSAYTALGIGGPAEVLAEPRDIAELAGLLRACREKNIPARVLGSGANVLVKDEGVRGVVVRLSAPSFCRIQTKGNTVRAGCGASLAHLIAQSVRSGLAGLESLVGIPGTVGGALKHNISDRNVEVGHHVHRIDVIDSAGQTQTRPRDELRFSFGSCNLDDPVLVAADFELEPDRADAILKRMRKSWIQRKATQPFSFQTAVRVFKNPAGLSAPALVEQAGLVGTRVGGAQVNDRDANSLVVEPDTAARDILRLIDLVRAKVQDRFHLELDLEISIWS